MLIVNWLSCSGFVTNCNEAHFNIILKSYKRFESEGEVLLVCSTHQSIVWLQKIMNVVDESYEPLLHVHGAFCWYLSFKAYDHRSLSLYTKLQHEHSG